LNKEKWTEEKWWGGPKGILNFRVLDRGAREKKKRPACCDKIRICAGGNFGRGREKNRGEILKTNRSRKKTGKKKRTSVIFGQEFGREKNSRGSGFLQDRGKKKKEIEVRGSRLPQ